MGRTGSPSRELLPAATAAANSAAVVLGFMELAAATAAEVELTAAAAAAESFKANSRFCLASSGFMIFDSESFKAKSAGKRERKGKFSNKALLAEAKLDGGTLAGGDMEEVLPAPELRGLMARRLGEGLMEGLLGNEGAQTICSGVILPLSSKDKFSLLASKIFSISRRSVSWKAEFDDVWRSRCRCRSTGKGERRKDKSKGAVDSLHRLFFYYKERKIIYFSEFTVEGLPWGWGEVLESRLRGCEFSRYDECLVRKLDLG